MTTTTTQQQSDRESEWERKQKLVIVMDIVNNHLRSIIKIIDLFELFWFLAFGCVTIE